eukprot:TRINITY_DN36302_c0_g1_i2.p1 TRINITY_DN36302_c0_g1~~TRINITY_DN36302_c0_g1_i2.p1  ORF type:complete len:347 (-),score=98.46 TRINITY_DN36302_c0_g1_i2:14-1054(-)
MLSESAVQSNTDSIRALLKRVLKDDEFEVVNNADWYSQMSVISFLRDVGKYFRVGTMLGKESVRSRSESDTGISFTEFSYQTLQGYDFLHLARAHNVRIQIGGSDQWGNITAGLDLIRKTQQNDEVDLVVLGMTVPLLTTASGAKFGKSEGNAVWLSKEKSSPYSVYQYLLNVEDADVIKLLKMLTFLDLEKIAEIEHAHFQAPENRAAHKVLASELISFIHGKKELQQAVLASQLLFGGNEFDLSQAKAQDVISACQDAGVPLVEVPRDEFVGIKVTQLAVLSKLVKSNSEARRLISSGGLSINGHKVTDSDELLSSEHLSNENQLCFVRSGKRKFTVIRLVTDL